MLSYQAICKAVQKFQAEVTAWENSDGPLVQWRGQTIRSISQSVEAAAVELFEACDTMDVENSVAVREIVLAVDKLDDAFSGWAEKCQNEPEATDPRGTNDVWSAYRELLTLLQPRPKRLPEPIKQLIQGGVSHFQIAKIYGWYDSGKNPDVLKVQAEIEKPGSQFDAKMWVHPSDQRRANAVATGWAERERQFGEKSRAAKVKQGQSRRKLDAPETWEELLQLPGITAEQIAKMKRCTVDDVRDAAAERGFPLDAQTIARIEPGRKAMELAAIDSHDECDTVQERILAMHAEGLSPKVIVQRLKDVSPELTVSAVAKVIHESEVAAVI